MEYEYAPILLDRDTCRDFSRSSVLEWVAANQTGGYAMGTVAGLNARRYHGLLIVSLDPPFQRRALLSSIDEEVEIESQRFQLATHQFQDGVRPQGFELLDAFRLDPFPAWEWTLNGAQFTKRVLLVEHKPAVVIEYLCKKSCVVKCRPLLAYRNYDATIHQNDELNSGIEQGPGYFRIAPYPQLPPLTVYFGAHGEFHSDGRWVDGFNYLIDESRGEEHTEDLYTPGDITLHIESGHLGWIVATLQTEAYDEEKVRNLTIEHRHVRVVGNTPFEARLAAASNQFLAIRDNGKATIMAGFPWFASWGRDAMISLPGLVITRGQFDIARSVIEGFLMHLNQGLIPNRYPDIGPPEYNTIDATLWMFQAVWSYVECGGGMSWVKDVFYPAAKEIIAWHERGTLYEIGVDPEDGLLRGGVEGTMLTWMDAKVGDWVVTPRRGKPIEVNALWYNALRIMLHWAAELEDLEYGHKIREMAKRTQRSFKKFWNARRHCAFDVLQQPDDAPDKKFRPNQIFAVSLPFPLFEPEAARGDRPHGGERTAHACWSAHAGARRSGLPAAL